MLGSWEQGLKRGSWSVRTRGREWKWRYASTIVWNLSRNEWMVSMPIIVGVFGLTFAIDGNL